MLNFCFVFVEVASVILFSSYISCLLPFLLQLMILVDDAGGAFPSINHSPWFGVTLADFVMPFFLFGVGVSVGLVFKVCIYLTWEMILVVLLLITFACPL